MWAYAGPQDQERNFIQGISNIEERLNSVKRLGISREDLPELVAPENELLLFGLGLHYSQRIDILNDPPDNVRRWRA